MWKEKKVLLVDQIIYSLLYTTMVIIKLLLAVLLYSASTAVLSKLFGFLGGVLVLHSSAYKGHHSLLPVHKYLVYINSWLAEMFFLHPPH